LANVLVRLEDHAEAAKVAVEVPHLFPDKWEAYFNAASFLDQCVRLTARDPNLTEARRVVVAQEYMDLCRYFLRQTLTRGQGSPHTQNEVARFLATCATPQLRDAPRAVELAKQAVDQAPKDGTFWNTLGIAHYRAGDWRGAIAALEESRPRRSGGDASDFFFLAMAHWQLGEKAEARQWYDRAIEWMKHNPKDDELDPFHAEAAALLGFPDPSLQKGKEAAPQK
jgi:uncharacterized protein HemY